MTGLRKFDVQEKEFQNVIDRTHISGSEKCTGKDAGRKKQGAKVLEALTIPCRIT